jgi:hypothetical protein
VKIQNRFENKNKKEKELFIFKDVSHLKSFFFQNF